VVSGAVLGVVEVGASELDGAAEAGEKKVLETESVRDILTRRDSTDPVAEVVLIPRIATARTSSPSAIKL